MKLPVCFFVMVRSGTGVPVTVTVSLAVAPGAPPPLIEAVFMIVAGAFDATDTVSVIAG